MVGESYFDVSSVQPGDKIYYYNIDDGEFILDVGEVKEHNHHKDGVEVYGEGWQQYVGKWFIARVERDNVVIFEQQEEEVEDSDI